MDNLPTFAELQELTALSEASIDSQFQFWLTVTFAIIVASFAGRHVLTSTLKHITAFLYTLSTFVFASRWYYDYLDLRHYETLFIEMGHDPSPPLLTAFSRILLMSLGSVATLYFVYWGTNSER